METYYDSAEGIELDYSRAQKELRDHGWVQEDIDDYLDAQTFPMCAQELLAELGY